MLGSVSHHLCIVGHPWFNHKLQLLMLQRLWRTIFTQSIFTGCMFLLLKKNCFVFCILNSSKKNCPHPPLWEFVGFVKQNIIKCFGSAPQPNHFISAPVKPETEGLEKHQTAYIQGLPTLCGVWFHKYEYMNYYFSISLQTWNTARLCF